MQKFINYIIILALVCVIIFMAIKNNQLVKARAADSQAIAAIISDSVNVRIKEGMKEFYNTVPVGDIKAIVNSPAFQSLDQEKRAFFEEISRVKRLISAAEATIRSKDSFIGTLTAGRIDSQRNEVCYKIGDKLNIADSTKSIKWSIGMTMGKPLSYKFDYDYRAKIRTTFNRERDGSVTVSYTSDDPTVDVSKIQSFKIPSELEGKTAVGKWLYKNRSALRIGIGATVFAGGVYVGNVLMR